MKNVIAIIWDFDKTLVDGYMQDPIFKDYNIDAKEFWDTVNALPEKYKTEQHVTVNPDTIYLNQFIHEAQEGGRMAGLNNALLQAYGKKQRYYPGLPNFFKETKHLLENDEKLAPWCKEYDIRVEHYIVSTGFAAVIRGTEIFNEVEDIWGCELIENDGRISEIGYTIDNTTKTRAIFEINKGVNAKVNEKGEHSVNETMNEAERRVDFRNMIYIADGPSDVPAFSVVKKNGGATFAIYPKGDSRAFEQVCQLRQDDRIEMFAEADYTSGSAAYMWICHRIKQLARQIMDREKSARTAHSVPRHLN